MYVGNLEQWQEEIRNLPEFLSPYIKKLAAFDFDALTAGRYELGGLNYMNVDEAETAPAAKRQIECHRRYVDVQVLLDGEEVIGYQPLSRLGAMTEDRGSKDYKTLLQELYQKKTKECPRYETVSVTGPDHDRTFSVTVHLGDAAYGPESRSGR